ncbi:hypothetical protein SAMN05421676_108116 [Salinibacillus kushneri]|uniref:Uncharacterized protein n=2 Tax=Salinibacillus kushneri TaxID=237682 RepID=A0A1I0H923_9BACI|nr:hypothetical protein SAMN05421676_108116 [Salinibacillus kushneri]
MITDEESIEEPIDLEKNDEKEITPEPKYNEVEIVIDTDIYSNYFNNEHNDETIENVIELIERAAKSVSPSGEVKIPKDKNLNSFFTYSNDELLGLFQKNNDNSQGELIMVVADKPFALQQAADLIEDEQIDKDLNYLADELFKIEFYQISDFAEFSTAYEKYVDIQKKILKIYYTIEYM